MLNGNTAFNLMAVRQSFCKAVLFSLPVELNDICLIIILLIGKSCKAENWSGIGQIPSNWHQPAAFASIGAAGEIAGKASVDEKSWRSAGRELHSISQNFSVTNQAYW
jgi:hypothetical protein